MHRRKPKALWILLVLIPLVATTASAQEVQSLEHDMINGSFHSLVQVDADTYALAYGGADDDGFIKTFTISPDGSTITQVQALEHDTLNGLDNSLVRVDADTYALAYRGDANDGFIKTFTISADGSTITQVQSLEHDTGLGFENSLVRVDADTYALAYGGLRGFIKTFTISADGSTITEVQSLEHDSSIGLSNSLVQVDTDTFALAYQGDANDGFIKTFTISADGSTITQIQSQEHDPFVGTNNSLVQVDADTYALAYFGGNSAVDPGGFIKTFTVSADGSTITQVQSLEYDPVNIATENSLVHVAANIYAVAYSGDASDGFIKTFTISADGSTITQVDSLEHDSILGRFNSLVQVDADTYALAYSGENDDGFIKTFMIDMSGGLPVSLMNFSVE